MQGVRLLLDDGALGIRTVHPRSGDQVEISGLPELKKVFEQLAVMMGLDGRLQQKDGAVRFSGRSADGEQTVLSHQAYLRGMPFELLVTTTRTVTASAGEKGIDLDSLEPAFGQDVRAALRQAGKTPDQQLAAVSETVRVETLAKMDWFPGMFEDLATLYRVTRIIRQDISREVWLQSLHLPGQILTGQVLTWQRLPSPERYVEQLFEQLTGQPSSPRVPQPADQPLSQAGDDHAGVQTVSSAGRAKEALPDISPDVPPDELIADILTELDEWARSG